LHSSSATAVRCWDGTWTYSSSNAARSRLLTWTDVAPYWRISGHPSSRYCSQRRPGTMTRGVAIGVAKPAAAAQVAAADHHEEVFDVVEHLDRGRRVVDGR